MQVAPVRVGVGGRERDALEAAARGARLLDQVRLEALGLTRGDGDERLPGSEDGAEVVLEGQRFFPPLKIELSILMLSPSSFFSPPLPVGRAFGMASTWACSVAIC